MNTEHLFRSLATLVAIDGEIGAQELRFLQTIRQRFNIPDTIIHSALHDAKQGKRRVHLPHNEQEQTVFLELLVQAAYADGIITPDEHNVLRTVAEKIGIQPEELQMKINEMYEGMNHPTTASVPECWQKTSHRQPPFVILPPSTSQPIHPPHPTHVKRQCPKCGYLTTDPKNPLFTGDKGHGECPACGIVLARYLERDKKRRRDSEFQRRAPSSKWGRSGVEFAQGTFVVCALIFMLFVVFSLFSQIREQREYAEYKSNIFASVYQISELPQAQAKARAQRKPIMFVYSRRQSNCSLTRQANFYLIEKMHTRAVIVFAEVGDSDWAGLPCFVQKEFTEIGSYIPRAVFVNSHMKDIVASIPHTKDSKGFPENALHDAEKQLASHLYQGF
jgi:uncharacterized tellurite resistance protein B-like protein/ribosomal protein S27AE